MKHASGLYLSFAVAMCATASVSAQSPQADSAGGRSEVYHVNFSKATLGEAVALGESLRTPDQTSPMPTHVLLLRHQHGDDWDFCVIQHLGPKATVEVTPTLTTPAVKLRAWHDDTFVAGPPWPEFAKAMGLDAAGGKGATGIYVLSMWRAAPGHRDQLQKVLSQTTPGSKVSVGNVVLQHLEGGAWQFLSISRYNSWEDFAADQTPAAPGAAEDGWAEARRHGVFHRDTIADRLPLK